MSRKKKLELHFYNFLGHIESNFGVLTGRVSTNMEEYVKSVRYRELYCMDLNKSCFSNGLLDSQ